MIRSLSEPGRSVELPRPFAEMARLFAVQVRRPYRRGMSTHHPNPPAEQDSTESWNSRYGEVAQRWSGHANSALVDAVASLPPGNAMEVGCGEGADAIWLARRGWAVTALDISAVAVSRARAAAGGLPITWLVADLATEPPVGAFDLVSVQYPALRKGPDDAAVAAILNAVDLGGRLLVVGHNLAALRAHHRMPAGLDPDHYVLPDDIARRLGEGWAIEVHETRPRRQPPGYDGPDIPDDVLLARRC